jgi:hypothetical protein
MLVNKIPKSTKREILEEEEEIFQPEYAGCVNINRRVLLRHCYNVCCDWYENCIKLCGYTALRID